MKTLNDWLSHAQHLHAQVIEMGLERVSIVAQRLCLAASFQNKTVITVAGTNGKGSTCAMLEAILEAGAYRTGVYTSPHLIDFEERCRLRGQSVDSTSLIQAMEKVEAARLEKEPIALTYFEFTTLAILYVLGHSFLDVVILEVGLGGRLDAVNVIDADCALLTCIDIDHIDYLGPDRESIGYQKAGIMRPQRPAIVADPCPPQSVIDYAREIEADLWLQGNDFSFSGDAQQWAIQLREHRMGGLAYPALRGVNQLINASGALAALRALQQKIPVSAQAIRTGLATVSLAGRFQIHPGQPTCVLDVAHNPHAVATLFASLEAQGFFPHTRVVFGAMADKDIPAMMKALLPLVDHWLLTDLPIERAAKASELEAHLRSLSPSPHTAISLYAHPHEAWKEAWRLSEPTDRIVIFGSFVTVGAVLPLLHTAYV